MTWGVEDEWRYNYNRVVLNYGLPTTLNDTYLFIEYYLRSCEYDLTSIGIIILSAHCNLYFI